MSKKWAKNEQKNDLKISKNLVLIPICWVTQWSSVWLDRTRKKLTVFEIWSFTTISMIVKCIEWNFTHQRFYFMYPLKLRHKDWIPCNPYYLRLTQKPRPRGLSRGKKNSAPGRWWIRHGQSRYCGIKEEVGWWMQRGSGLNADVLVQWRSDGTELRRGIVKRCKEGICVENKTCACNLIRIHTNRPTGLLPLDSQQQHLLHRRSRVHARLIEKSCCFIAAIKNKSSGDSNQVSGSWWVQVRNLFTGSIR